MSEMADEQTTESDDIEAVQEGMLEDAEINTKADVEGAEAESEVDEVVVSIGDESPPPEDQEHAQAPTWVKELRKSHREIQRENRELKEKLKAKEEPAVEALAIGKEPDLEDYDFDPDRFKQEWKVWNEKRGKVEQQQAEVKAKKEAEDQAWKDKLNAYGEAKAKLKVSDYEEAEHVLQELMSQTQQGILIQGADSPALLVYALGKNPEKAKELAAIKDPVKYAFALAKLESQLKVTKRSAPAPDKPVSTNGSASLSGAMDSTLDRLRKEAERTGDYSKVHQYRRQTKK